MKGLEAGRFDQAWGGIASLSTALPVLWTEASARGFTRSDLARWTSSAPAELLGLSAQIGSIAPGHHANLVAFDPDAHLTITPDILHYRHKISPYMNESLRGVVHSTWLRGERIFHHGSFPTSPHGREYARSC
jgi:allantoinase